MSSSPSLLSMGTAGNLEFARLAGYAATLPQDALIPVDLLLQ